MAKPKIAPFKNLMNKLDNTPAVDNIKAPKASIGRKKYGKKLVKSGNKNVVDGMDASVQMEHPSAGARKKAMLKK